MKMIQVLGPGCSKCAKLKENVETAVQQASIEATVEKVTDINQMMSLGVMMTPALVVDGEVKSSGKVLSPEDIKQLLE